MCIDFTDLSHAQKYTRFYRADLEDLKDLHMVPLFTGLR